ncbi:hypothetical protein U6B65_06660 [Oscillospiraceae bacterium MB08-C2-2]|nr:hypothetical protein U6B65_06660 [Oscillospiraceae bacterium MB08-C2-2]
MENILYTTMQSGGLNLAALNPLTGDDAVKSFGVVAVLLVVSVILIVVFGVLSSKKGKNKKKK